MESTIFLSTVLSIYKDGTEAPYVDATFYVTTVAPTVDPTSEPTTSVPTSASKSLLYLRIYQTLLLNCSK